MLEELSLTAGLVWIVQVIVAYPAGEYKNFRSNCSEEKHKL